jgi:hypothetical protein
VVHVRDGSGRRSGRACIHDVQNAGPNLRSVLMAAAKAIFRRTQKRVKVMSGENCRVSGAPLAIDTLAIIGDSRRRRDVRVPSDGGDC